MKYGFYTNSEEAWSAMRAAIAIAKESIYWELYILSDDETARSFLTLLKNKAANGVKVKIILDSLGSMNLFSNLSDELRSAGVELLYFNRFLPWWNPMRLRMSFFTRTHRKLLIVDRKIGFIGGVNIGSEYRKWLDLHMRVEGNIVRRFVKSFAKSYKICGGKDNIATPSKNRFRLKMWFLDHAPFIRKSLLKRFYIEKCAAAKKSVIMASPYFVPHKWLLRVLEGAIKRGVKVEVIMPLQGDLWFLDVAGKAFADIGLSMGINFYFIPQMFHAKALLVDDAVGMVGSTNLDARSFDYNAESSVVFQEADMVGDLRDIFEKWKTISAPYTEVLKRRRWYHVFLMRLLRLLQPVL